MVTRKVVQAIGTTSNTGKATTQQAVLPIMAHTVKNNLTVRNGKRVAQKASNDLYIATVEQQKERVNVVTPVATEIPKVIVQSDTSVPSVVELLTTPIETPTQTAQPVVVTPKRMGRPKGSKNAPKTAAVKPTTAKGTTAATVKKESMPVIAATPTADAPVVVKRSPGRPKGSKNVAKVVAPVAVKKPIGRPRKVVVDVQTAPVVKATATKVNAPVVTERTTVTQIENIVTADFSTTARPLYIMRLPLTMDVPSAVQSRIIDERYILPTATEIAAWKKNATVLVRNPEFAGYAAMKQEDDKPIKALYNAQRYGSHLLPVFAVIDYVDSKSQNAGSMEQGVTEYSAPYQTFATRRTPRNTISVETLRVSHLAETRGNVAMGADVLNSLFYALDAPQLRQWVENLLTTIAPAVRRIGETEAAYNSRLNPVAQVAPIAPKGKIVNVATETRQLAKSRLTQLFS